MFLYFIEAGKGGPIKIGIANNVDKRIVFLQTGNHRKLSILKTFKLKDEEEARIAESNLHNYFKHTRLNGEWFMPTPYMRRYILENLGVDKGILVDKIRTWDDAMFGITEFNKYCDPLNDLRHVAEEFAKDGHYNAVDMLIKDLDELMDNICYIRNIERTRMLREMKKT